MPPLTLALTRDYAALVNENAPALVTQPGAWHQEASPDAVLSLCTRAWGRLMPLLRDRLALYLREEASWRADKAGEFPDDQRNVWAAGTLWAFADYVDSLPLDNESLRALEALQRRYKLDLFAPGEQSERILGKLGFHEEVSDFGLLLDPAR